MQVESGYDGLCEQESLSKLRDIMSKNKVYKSFIGNGFHDTVVPEVIKRNILEHPGWYTAYTVPGRDFAGQAGDATEFPDNGDRSGKHGCL